MMWGLGIREGGSSWWVRCTESAAACCCLHALPLADGMVVVLLENEVVVFAISDEVLVKMCVESVVLALRAFIGSRTALLG